MATQPTVTGTENQQAGLEHVEAYLMARGFFDMAHDTEGGKTEITANGIRVLVKTTLAPGTPTLLNSQEKSLFIKKADKEDREAYIAYVVVDQKGALVGDLDWRKLE